jgi:hypothetical protein
LDSDPAEAERQARQLDPAFSELVGARLPRASARRTFEMLPQNARFMSGLLSKLTSGRQVRSAAEGEARALLRVLESRGIATSVEQCEPVLAAPISPRWRLGWIAPPMATTAQAVFAD